MRINRDARVALLRGFESRGIKGWEAWDEFAEREALGEPESFLTRIEMDFGPEVSVAAQDVLIDEVGANFGPLPLASPPQVAGMVKLALRKDPAAIVPMALPDELFGAYIVAAWDVFCTRDHTAFVESLGSVYEAPDPGWLNNILSKQQAPCQLVNGEIEWTDPNLLGEQPLTAALADWPGIRGELRRIREAFRRAETSDDFNAIGARLDRLLISLGREVFDPALDLPNCDPEPAKDDSKARITLYLQGRAKRKHRAAIRQSAEPIVKAAYDQAQIVKHNRESGRAATGVAISLACVVIDMVAEVRTA